MRRTVAYIDCPDYYNSENDWDSHKPMLNLCLNNTKGYVVEMGMGFGSTPMISFHCNINSRVFYSYETNREWYNKCAMFDCGKILTDDYLMQDIGDVDLLFVDAAPGEVRKKLIDKYKDIVGVIVVHDTEPGAEYVYGMNEVLSTFKYRLDYTPEGKPHTTAVSNTVNVSEWI